MRFSFAADTNKKRKLTICGFHARYRPVASAMSITMTVNVEHPNMTQPVHETAPMLPASRSRCHSAKKYRVKTCGRVAASSPTMATIPKTTSVAIIRRSLRPGATLVLSGFINSYSVVDPTVASSLQSAFKSCPSIFARTLMCLRTFRVSQKPRKERPPTRSSWMAMNCTHVILLLTD
jgi:hypothetical protein